MHNIVFEPSAVCVHKRAVLSHVLLFYHSYLCIQLSAESRLLIECALIHIIIHRLCCGGDYHGVEYGEHIAILAVDMVSYAIVRMSMLCYRRSARHYLDVLPYEFLSLHSLLHFEKICISVQVVEVFKKSKVKSLFDVSVLLSLRKHRSQIDSQMLIANRMLQDVLVERFEIGDTLLLLLSATGKRKLTAYVVVVAITGKAMQKVD